MLVRIAMIEREPGGAERLELRGDFGREFTARLPVKSNESAQRRHIGAKQRRFHRRDGVTADAGSNGPALYQHQMQADTQVRAYGGRGRPRRLPRAPRPSGSRRQNAVRGEPPRRLR